MNSPVGRLALFASGKGLHCILWEKETRGEEYDQAIRRFKQALDQPLLNQTKQQLIEYFQGKRKDFSLPYLLVGTPFQRRAWQALCTIGYGETISYSEQASRLGDKNKARAVGLANAKNPIPIIIPCHRVMGKNGKLTGFAGGIDNKQRLLMLEENWKK